jgi:hypothetical protein
MKALCLFLMTTVLLGCTAHHAPYIAYEEKVSLSQTSVFLAVNQNKNNGLIVAEVTRTDGKDMPCPSAGCPVWVRVLPGEHKFTVLCRSNFSLAGSFISFSEVKLEVPLPNMMPRHVYQASYRETNGGLSVQIIDHGENPSIGIDLSYMGYHVAKFSD